MPPAVFRSRVAFITAALAVHLTAAAQTPVRVGPVDGAGLRPDDLARIRVGTPAPDFTLEGVDGRPVTLSSFRGRKHVVLIFYRGHW
jgi:cytochrome oxidase Cu insertion factor (SCO1/SenC/PrrC family)